MAVNTDEEHLENSVPIQSENPPEAIIPNNDTQPINPNQEIENMEVHHHAHDPAAPHHKKNWKSYFWEFLMLFLAVFCGFLAEYQLEHKIERDREKQFINSILKDLAEDNLALSATIISYDESQKRNDSLIRLLCSPNVKDNGAYLYYLGRKASKSGRLAIHDATIQQLKNSGGLRLIQKENVSKAIIEYYNHLVIINYYQKIEDDEIMEYRKMAGELFHPILFNDIAISVNTVIVPSGNPALLTYDSKTLFRIASMVSYVRNTRIGLAKAETEMQLEAQNLIELIKKEYHLELK